jgi:chromosomal replication initiation ATPase DnaA
LVRFDAGQLLWCGVVSCAAFVIFWRFLSLFSLFSQKHPFSAPLNALSPFLTLNITQAAMQHIEFDYARIAEYLNIPNLEQRLHSDSRSRKLVDVRRAVAALFFEQGYSITEIARELHRDHKTIRYHLHSHRQLRDVDVEYQTLLGVLNRLTENTDRFLCDAGSAPR